MFTRNAHSTARLTTGLSHYVTASAAIVLAIFACQASAQAPPFGLPDRGVLRLQLGDTAQENGLHSPKRFVHQPSGLSQSIDFNGKCGLFLGGPSSLAVLTAAGGLNTMGLGPNSIGVYDGRSGVACYRISSSAGESVTFGLGADVSASTLIDANAFYRLELDVEVKQNGEYQLQIIAGGAVTAKYRLRTGTSIIAGQGSYSPGSPDHIMNCSALSDSNPDEGAADNCRWIVDAIGQSFRLIPLFGELSLEGGGDFGTAAYANNTLIYLTKGDVGALGCQTPQVPQGTNTSIVGDGVNTAQCGVTRIDPTGIGGSCTKPIGYILRNVNSGQQGCEINKAPDEQLAASVDLVFPPETATALGAEPPTTIKFSTNVPGQLVPYTPGRCFGTVVNDHNGKPTIAEVLSQPGFVPDLVPGTPTKDWACILTNDQDYIGGGKMRVRQTILFWGDIQFSRQ